MATSPLITVSVLILALLLDRVWGEPRHLHPLIGFGLLASALERRFNSSLHGRWSGRMRGFAAVVLLVLVPLSVLCLLTVMSSAYAPIAIALSTLLLYLTIGARSLGEHAGAVAVALRGDDLTLARLRVSYMVSRETAALDERACCGATVESVLENGSDSIVAPLLWFALGSLVGLGAVMAVGYRIINTLDAMWGYRNERYQHFGWGAAKLDDVANYLPARLCAVSYALVAGSYRNARQSLYCWRTQGGRWQSPNAGPVMASGAGALDINLGGAARYHGAVVQRPPLGAGAVPIVGDIERSLSLLNRAVIFALLTIAGTLYLAEITMALVQQWSL